MPSFVVSRAGVKMAAPILPSPSGLAGNAFDFLHSFHAFGNRIDWHIPTKSRLWRYNLHYFDYALDPSREQAWIVATMEDWIAANPLRKSVAWEPYPTSLRIVNWIKFDLTVVRSRPLSPVWRRSLYQQIAWLERNLEHEIQANHLLKNAKALLFGGVYFSGRTAERWMSNGRQLFLREAREQLLRDGGHYERSAMYHAVAVEDLLDVLNLAYTNRDLMTDTEISELEDRAKRALGYLSDISFPDGTISISNDSAMDVGPKPSVLAGYARAILPSLRARPCLTSYVIERPATGYFGYRHGQEMLLIDAGPPGPPHQPGHAHCGLLGFELMVGGRPLIVDSGVCDYENASLRRILRGTAAHNTLRIDGEEQSDLWGAFRIGRRARVQQASLEHELPTRFWFTGSHDGYRHLAGKPRHHRTIECEIGRSWRIKDRVEGGSEHSVESFLHFHPGLRLQRRSGAWIVIDESGHALYRIEADGGDADIFPSVFCPQFGIRQANWMLRLAASGPLPVTIGFSIEAI
jgi:uncharacterized heparinase superfamily protein